MSEPDEFHGQGGSYAVDPATGQRKLVERTQDAGTEPAAAQQPEQPQHAEE